MFEKLFRGMKSREKPNGDSGTEPGAEKPLQVVMSVPHEHRDTFFPRVPGVKLTYDVVHDLFRSARSEVRVFSPYIDATFTSLALQSQAPIRVITTLREKKQKSLGVVERCASSRDLAVRYIHQKKGESHLYQLHAKMILADEFAGYVGSANLTDASVHYNFELGFLVRDAGIVKHLVRIFDYLYDHVGFPAKVA